MEKIVSLPNVRKIKKNFETVARFFEEQNLQSVKCIQMLEMILIELESLLVTKKIPEISLDPVLTQLCLLADDIYIEFKKKEGLAPLDLVQKEQKVTKQVVSLSKKIIVQNFIGPKLAAIVDDVRKKGLGQIEGWEIFKDYLLSNGPSRNLLAHIKSISVDHRQYDKYFELDSEQQIFLQFTQPEMIKALRGPKEVTYKIIEKIFEYSRTNQTNDSGKYAANSEWLHQHPLFAQASSPYLYGYFQNFLYSIFTHSNFSRIA